MDVQMSGLQSKQSPSCAEIENAMGIGVQDSTFNARC